MPTYTIAHNIGTIVAGFVVFAAGMTRQLKSVETNRFVVQVKYTRFMLKYILDLYLVIIRSSA